MKPYFLILTLALIVVAAFSPVVNAKPIETQTYGTVQFKTVDPLSSTIFYVKNDNELSPLFFGFQAHGGKTIAQPLIPGKYHWYTKYGASSFTLLPGESKVIDGYSVNHEAFSFIGGDR